MNRRSFFGCVSKFAIAATALATCRRLTFRKESPMISGLIDCEVLCWDNVTNTWRYLHPGGRVTDSLDATSISESDDPEPIRKPPQ